MMKPALSPLSKPVTLSEGGHTITWGKADQWVFFGGTNSFESEGLVLEVAQEFKRMTTDLGIPWIMKCSFDKANRQSAKSFRGPGMIEGLKGLARIKSKVGCLLVTDIHDETQIPAVAEVADVIQIPAFLCRQTDLLVAAAKTGKVLHIKKGQFMAPWDMGPIVEKAAAAGNDRVLLCDRGVSFGYNRLVTDMTAFPEMRKFGKPVVIDASHSVQLPGGKGNASDGRREMIEVLARSAMAAGIDGLFCEAHPDPDKALCDAPNMLPLKDMPALLKRLQMIWKAVQS